MKRVFYLLSVFILVLGMSGFANAYSIDDKFITVNGNEFASFYWPTAENFNSGTPSLGTWLGSYSVLTGSAGQYSAPAGVDGTKVDPNYYVTVPIPGGGSGSVTVSGLPMSNYFGLWWGSMDAYNTLTFLLNGNPTGESFTGSQVVISGLADGEQTGYRTNHYVNFIDLLPFNGFTMTSTTYAFEADNIAIGNRVGGPVVPIPPTVYLLGAGLLGLVGLRRRFRK